MLTEGTVDVPVAGRMKKAYIVVPAGIAAVYVAYRWHQSRQAAASTPSTSDGTYTTPDLTDYGLSTSGGATSITGNTGSTVTDGTNGLSTNADWTNKAIELLTNQGYDGATVAAALGDFLARKSLTTSEASIARAALAVAGPPPVGGPFSVIEEATTGGTGTLAAPANLKVRGHSPTVIKLQWDAVPGALHYRIYRTDLDQGEPIGDSVDTLYNAGGLTPNTSYGFFVRAMSTSNKTGEKSATVTGKTDSVKLSVPTGLKASAVTRSSFRVTCSKVAGATYYRWYLNGQAHGASDNAYYDFTGLRPNTTYKVTVAADTTTQTPTTPSAALSVKTKS